MKDHNSLSSNWMSSHNCILEILGAFILSKPKAVFRLLLISALVVCVLCCAKGREIFYFAIATYCVYIVWQVVRTLNPIYCLRKEESRITWSQISLLASFGGWLLIMIMLLDIKKDDTPSFIMASVIGAVLGWIFQDTIKSVVAFFYLRANNLLKIGDWIEVPSHGVDGFIKGITLTTVTLENWDTTTSAFPTYILHAEHFKNYQDMLDGKTYGRRMLKTFIIDTGWIHTMSEEELDKLKNIRNLDKDKQEFLKWFACKNDEKCMLNIELYRQYVYHWLMHHPHVSHEPRLIVRWLEQIPEGMPLQVYAFITDSSLAAFEWQQSQIMEHIIEALAWFNLQLYQSPSGYDASNGNIKMVEESANYRRKTKENGEIQ